LLDNILSYHLMYKYLNWFDSVMQEGIPTLDVMYGF
jgi:hypothetical protein